MSTPGRRLAMTKELGDLFVQKGKILTEGEYLALGEKAPYRITAVKKSLGNWLRAVEKVKSANPDLAARIAKTSTPATKSILEQMAEKLKAAAATEDKTNEDTE